MKKQLKAISLIVTLVMMLGVFFSVAVSAAEASSDTLTPDTSWYIERSKTKTATLRDAEDLAGFAKLVSEGVMFMDWTVKLGKDIVYNTGNAADFETNAPANVWTPIEGFFGTFDGQGYTISGLYFDDVTKSNIGLFAVIDGVTVKNVSIVNSYFRGQRMIGSIAGVASGLASTISNCYSDAILKCNVGTVDGAFVGGMLGRAAASLDANGNAVGTLVEKCWYDGSIYATSTKSGGTSNLATRVGGIVGSNDDGKGKNAEYFRVVDCLTKFDAIVENTASGVVGYVWACTPSVKVENCFTVNEITNTRNIASSHFSSQFVGIAADTSAVINNVYGLEGWTLKVTTQKVVTDEWKHFMVALRNETATYTTDEGKQAPTRFALDAVTGDAAKTACVGFDFEGDDAVWVTVADGTPVLKALAYIAANKTSGQAEAAVDPNESIEDGTDDNTGEDNTGDNTDDNTGNDTGDDDMGNTDSADKDTADTGSADTQKPTDDTVAEEENKGCGGSVMSIGAVAIISVFGMALAKKKD